MPDIAESKETLDEVVDRAKAAGIAVVDRATIDAQGLITQLSKNIEDIVFRAMEELKRKIDYTLAELDGWTLTIPPIQLTKPKETK